MTDHSHRWSVTHRDLRLNCWMATCQCGLVRRAAAVIKRFV